MECNLCVMETKMLRWIGDVTSLDYFRNNDGRQGLVLPLLSICFVMSASRAYAHTSVEAVILFPYSLLSACCGRLLDTTLKKEMSVWRQHLVEESALLEQKVEKTQSMTSLEDVSTARLEHRDDTTLDAVDSITLTWKDIWVETHKGRTLLRGISGFARPGELTALMGVSGSGKTTLLNVFLCRNLKGLKVEGRVHINGNAIGRRIAAISGYAQQEEMFVGTLTVREYLSIQARLRTVLPKERREMRVDAVLSTLGLIKCQNNRIGGIGVKGISGGEMRRLAFGCELLSNPALLFCDEPTTGLDSFLAEHVVEVLSKLAKTNRTVLCTIHQPASQIFLMFDRVMFIANGRTAFFGTPKDCVDFFKECGYECPKNYNPADIIIYSLSIVPHEEEACRERIDAICDTYENGSYGSAVMEELDKVVSTNLPRGRRRAKFTVQLSTLFHRYYLDNMRSAVMHSKLQQKFFMGIFVGLLYFQEVATLVIAPSAVFNVILVITSVNVILPMLFVLHGQVALTMPHTVLGVTNINNALFFLCCELTFSTLFGVITLLPSDFPLVLREYHDSIYPAISYFIARVLSYLPIFGLDGLLMFHISYWMIGLSSSVPCVIVATLISFLVEQTACAFGVMLACICPSYPVAASVAGPVTTLLFITGGLFVNVSSLTPFIAWIQYFSWFRYGFEAYLINQWSKGDSSSDKNAQEILAMYSFKQERLWFDIAMMVLLILLYLFIGYIALAIRLHRGR